MNLAYFLPLGGSLASLRNSGQDKRFLEGELSYYLQKFDKIYIFDYSSVRYDTHNERIIQICNFSGIHRFIYAFIFPTLHRRIIKSCSVIRVSHLSGVIAGFVAKLFYRKKLVFNYAYNYADFAWKEKKYIRSILLKFLVFVCFHIASGIIVASRNCIHVLIHEYKNKTIWIPNGVDIKKFRPKDFKPATNTSRTVYNILFVGRLTPQKNIINLTEAIKLINNKNIRLTIIGKGELENEIKEKCNKYDINLELIEKVDNEKLPEFYNSCDLFVLPSFAEGSSKVLLEAMSCGSLCLVSKIPENTEIVKDGQNGFVCGFSAEEIADRIKYIMKHINTDKIKKNARNTIEKEYSMDIVMKKEVDFVCKYAT